MDSVLDLKFKPLGFQKKITIREYAKELVCKLIEEGEGFSSKRPFGNSSWDFDMFKILLQHGYVGGTYDEDNDEIVEIDPNAAAKVITNAIMKEM